MYATPLAIAQGDQLIPLPEVQRRTGMGRSRIYAAIRQNPPTFPKPVKIGTSSRWLLVEVEQFIRDRIAERDKAAA